MGYGAFRGFHRGGCGAKAAASDSAARQADGDFADFDARTMAWAIRNLIDGVNRRRILDLEFDFNACIRGTL